MKRGRHSRNFSKPSFPELSNPEEIVPLDPSHPEELLPLPRLEELPPMPRPNQHVKGK